MDKINVNKSDFLALQEYASEQLRKEFDSVGLTDSLPIMEKAYRLNLMELFDDMLGDARCSCDTAAQRWVLKSWFENLTEDDSDFSSASDMLTVHFKGLAESLESLTIRKEPVSEPLEMNTPVDCLGNMQPTHVVTVVEQRRERLG